MLQIGILGAGIVGSAIAYELSRIPGLEVHVFEKNAAAHWGATGAALGVLLGGLSQKRSGNHLHLRQASLKRWETLIPELESITGQPLPYNRHGILELCFDSQAWGKWQTIQPDRINQGFPLMLWTTAEVQARYPQINTAGLVGAIFSDQDRQIQPIPVTQALRQAATIQGARFYYQADLHPLQAASGRIQDLSWQCSGQEFTQSLDRLIITAGLGTMALTALLGAPIPLQAVLGQAIHYRHPDPIHEHWPVIQGADLHLVPLSTADHPGQDFWIGATVEFSDPPDIVPTATPQPLAQLHLQAKTLFPFLTQAEVISTWSGLRSRPIGRPAPIIELLPGYENIYLATGHYRNGILLAPLTAQLIATQILERLEPR